VLAALATHRARWLGCCGRIGGGGIGGGLGDLYAGRGRGVAGRGPAGSLAVTGSGQSRQLGVQVADGLCRAPTLAGERTGAGAAGAGPMKVLGQAELEDIGPQK
jgi:hypothetical protein